MTSNPDRPMVASIIVTFNPDIEHLRAVLRSHQYASPQILVIVDNGSGNQHAVLELAAGLFVDPSSFRWVPLPRNEGLASALNIGIHSVRGGSCTHVALFDQDSVIPENLLRILFEESNSLIAAGHRVAALGPTYVDPRSGNEYPQSRAAGLRLKKVWLKLASIRTTEVSFIITSGSLIPMDVFDTVGFMREDFFIDCVDIEWCFRARSKGYEIFATSIVTMAHSIGDQRQFSLGREISIHSPLRRYYMARNSVTLARLGTVPLGYRCREVWLSILRTPLFLLAVRFDSRYVRMIGLGYLHGLTGRLGKLETT